MKKRVPKKKKTSREVRRELRSIYANREGKMPDLSKLSRAHKSKLTGMLTKAIILLFVLAIVAWSGFFLFTRGLFDNDETLQLSIDGPEDIASGETTHYTIRYKNNGSVPIASLEMKLNLPDTFHIFTSVPEPTDEDLWTIGSLSPGSDGAINIEGLFLAEVPSSQRIQALFTYKPANFSSDFQDIVNAKIDVEKSVVELALSGPQKALAGDQSSYTIDLQNTSKEPVYNLRVVPLFPSDFTITKSDPKIEEDKTYWEIQEIGPGELASISINGSFTSSASGEQTIKTQLGFIDDDVFLIQSEAEAVTDVLGGNLVFHAIVNGSNESQTAEVGEILRTSIDFRNNGTETIHDLSFELILETDDGKLPIDWSRAEFGDGKKIGGTLRWSESELSVLSKLNPTNEGVIDLSLPILDSITGKYADSFTMSLQAKLSKVGSVFSARTIEATPIDISLNSDLRLTTQARYYNGNGEPFGSGPLPPQVSQTTTYRVLWNLHNSLHDLDNVKVTTQLPKDVSFTEQTGVDVGEIKYNSTTRQVSWRIPKLSANVNRAQAWFDVAVTPITPDVGTFIKLTNITTVEADDTVTEDRISQSKEIQTTQLKGDEYAAGKGVVLD